MAVLKEVIAPVKKASRITILLDRRIITIAYLVLFSRIIEGSSRTRAYLFNVRYVCVTVLLLICGVEITLLHNVSEVVICKSRT
ncbi:hypothetical protein DK37_13015 [Halomonas sp. SUBG004]|nr:hypothetical protein DK37_13015 [Halomonas sp. SUBG004]